MRNPGGNLAQGRQPFGTAEPGLHLVQGGDVHIESLIHQSPSVRISDGNPLAQHFTYRTILMEEPKDRYVGPALFHRLRELGEDTIPIFWVNGLLDRFQVALFIGIQPGENLVIPIAEHKRSEEHTSELQSLAYLVCRLLLEKKKTTIACTQNDLFM